MDVFLFHGTKKRKKVVAQSSSDAEYISATTAGIQATWLRRILTGKGQIQNEATILQVDSKSATATIYNHGK